METSVLTYEDTSVLNSGLDAFPPTYFLSEPDHSNHSFCLKAPECSLCAGDESKCRGGTVTKTGRVSFTEWWWVTDGRRNESQ